jgi:hypothetical protein
VYNALSSYRFDIYKSAVETIFDVDGDLKVFNLLFGSNQSFVVAREAFGTQFIDVSFHSAYLRLLLVNGLLYYAVSLLAFAIFVVTGLADQSVRINKVVLSFISGYVVFGITDMAFFTNFSSSYIPYVLQVFSVLSVAKLAESNELKVTQNGATLAAR